MGPKPQIRLLEPKDSRKLLTELLHWAYARLADNGLNYTAADQTCQTTEKRISEGECWVAELDGRIVGTAVLAIGGDSFDPPLYLQQKVAHFGQFAVEPDMQEKGIGTLLLKRVERRACELGVSLLALNTAEPATPLTEYYGPHGYAVAAHHQWIGKRYASVVMAKRLVRSRDQSGRSALAGELTASETILCDQRR